MNGIKLFAGIFNKMPAKVLMRGISFYYRGMMPRTIAKSMHRIEKIQT